MLIGHLIPPNEGNMPDIWKCLPRLLTYGQSRMEPIQRWLPRCQFQETLEIFHSSYGYSSEKRQLEAELQLMQGGNMSAEGL